MELSELPEMRLNKSLNVMVLKNLLKDYIANEHYSSLNNEMMVAYAMDLLFNAENGVKENLLKAKKMAEEGDLGSTLHFLVKAQKYADTTGLEIDYDVLRKGFEEGVNNLLSGAEDFAEMGYSLLTKTYLEIAQVFGSIIGLKLNNDDILSKAYVNDFNKKLELAKNLYKKNMVVALILLGEADDYLSTGFISDEDARSKVNELRTEIDTYHFIKPFMERVFN